MPPRLLPRGTTSCPPGELSLHPEAALVPEMTRAEYAELRREIERRGVLVPLEITQRRVVLDGRERLRAALELGLPQVPVRIVDPDDEVEHMLRAALHRRHLSASQKTAIALELLNYQELREAGRKRQRGNLRQNASEVATLPPRGKIREQVAEIAGASARTAQDVITVYENDRGLFEQIKAGDLAADVAARKVKRRKRDAALPPPPPLPEGPFELIYADPPWQMGNPEGRWAPENHYPTMSLQDIESLAVPAAENAVLFLWAVNCILPEAIDVMRAWGFTYKSNLVWVKPSIGPGRRVRNRHELLLYGQKGKLSAPELEDLPDSVSVIKAPRARHSEKPKRFYELIERMYPQASKVELFARGNARPGWVAWGNQAGEPAEPETAR
jgi:N6-adenosine-specific RNA methylase IME4/ParB-like chromosome segregation protein Spo0J